MSREPAELIIIEPETVFEVFTKEGGTAPILAKVRAAIDAFVPDMSTAKGRDEIRSMAHKVARSKSYLEEQGKRLADEQKAIPKKIDAARREIKETLDAWKDEVRRPLTEWEQAEEQRIAGHQRDLAWIAGLRVQPDSTAAAEDIALALQMAREFDVSEAARQEFVPEFTAARDAAVSALETALAARRTWEADQAELAALRAERAKREEAEAARLAVEQARRREEEAARAAAEREARIREEEAEAARIRAWAAEQRLKDEAEARERQLREESQARERELREAAERAQREAAETEARIKREAEAKAAAEAAAKAEREADTMHKGAVMRAALDALMAGGVDETAGRLVVRLIVAGRIPAVTIAF